MKTQVPSKLMSVTESAEVSLILAATSKSVEKRLARCKEREELLVEKQAKLR